MIDVFLSFCSVDRKFSRLLDISVDKSKGDLYFTLHHICEIHIFFYYCFDLFAASILK